MTNKTIYLSSPHMGSKELTLVTEAFHTNWIAPVGPHIDAFEKELSSYVGGSEVAVLSSGTAAIHLSLVLLGVQEEDYVICQSMTFSASANPIRYQGAIPIFVDSEEDTWNMCPEALEKAIQGCLTGDLPGPWTGKARKPKAIIPVHLYGVPAKMKEIMAIAQKYEIPVIEDAAEAMGAHIQGKHCGTFGDFGVFSFNGNKIITTSSGGALISPSKASIAAAKHLATQARDEAPHYQHSKIGYNYRMSNVLAGIGRGQLEVLDERVRARRANFEFYRSALREIQGISFLEELPDYYANRWLSCIIVDPAKTGGVDREQLRRAMQEVAIESRPLWKPMHMQPVFENFPYFGKKVSELLFERGLCLPSGSNLSEGDLGRVVEVILSKVNP
ncbi:DegT/DnrJ/EryC1/StrS family aminotransferase [Mongoliitalea daihaiensis]|uniref:DegT/DnrJ/EryC1/StrS family aminotransferase n=1 Tax=Mongoliitalea daihaiensis TaxID=2782006 RepID=UPI001F1AB736|nr:aminotransferase class I/II-fold pyridoxal phosphate-dependent enzyme [Mongoliitalea daihaiensis]UJP64444.1 aminotransferase class I/II-fold pyridoxal phosphate-dependent enzyme [Mongoliitalea daihaiensis]